MLLYAGRLNFIIHIIEWITFIDISENGAILIDGKEVNAMNTAKENSKAAFNQQAATYDKDIKGQHARSLYPVLLEKLSHIPFQSALDLGCGTGEMLKLILQEDVGKELF